MRVILSLFLASSLAIFAEKPTNFIQVVEDEQTARLQTSVTTYRKGDTTVSLIGAIHIADKAYYEALNQEFTKYPALLFELIGGEAAAKTMNGKGPQEEMPKADGRPAEGLRGIYGSFARTMNLSEQVHWIDYTPKNFVHADFTLAEFEKATEGKEDGLLAFALNNSIKSSEITGEPFGGINMSLMMRAILTGDGTALKLEYMNLMDSGDEAAAAITGKNLVVGDRNNKCFKVLAAQQKKGVKKIGIFYGAAHFPDMERRLLADGYQRQEHSWLTAWEVPKPAPKAKEES